MSLFFDIAQGAGLASATGVRPFLPPLLAGALASGDIGTDFDGTGYAFLESPGFLAAILGLAVLAYVLERFRREAERGGARSSGASMATASGGGSSLLTGSGPEAGAARAAPLLLTALAVTLGALLFAGSLAAGGEEAWPGLPAGAACAALGAAAAVGLLDRVRRRLDESAAALLPAWADAAALVLAGIAILFPPLALAGLAGLAYLLVAGRRARGEKYRGLRILR